MNVSSDFGPVHNALYFKKFIEIQFEDLVIGSVSSLVVALELQSTPFYQLRPFSCHLGVLSLFQRELFY